MPSEDKSTLSRLLSLLVEEIAKEKTLESIEAIHREGREEWPMLADVEGAYVGKVLRYTRGNKQAAARVLNIDRKTLDRMIRRHSLSKLADGAEPHQRR